MTEKKNQGFKKKEGLNEEDKKYIDYVLSFINQGKKYPLSSIALYAERKPRGKDIRFLEALKEELKNTENSATTAKEKKAIDWLVHNLNIALGKEPTYFNAYFNSEKGKAKKEEYKKTEAGKLARQKSYDLSKGKEFANAFSVYKIAQEEGFNEKQALISAKKMANPLSKYPRVKNALLNKIPSIQKKQNRRSRRK